MKIRIMSKINILYAAISALILLLSGCKDDTLFNEYYFGEGEGRISASVTFSDIPVSLATRGVEGGMPGDAIEDIKSLCVLVYNSKGNFIKKYSRHDGVNEFSDYKSETVEQTSPSDAVNGDKEHQAQTSTVRVTFSLGNPEETLPYGIYHMYAVANMGDLSGKDYRTEESLKKIILKWDSEHIAANNQMFGYFTNTGKEKSEGFGPENVIVKEKTVTVHSWIKRAVSKVTIAFDGRKLKENVNIYLKSAKIIDIPDECFLGATNPGKPDSEISFAPQTQEFIYGKGENYDDNWEAHISSGNPVYGANTEILDDSSKTFDEKLSAQHEADTQAFYFFENMQGTGIEGTESDKRQQVKPEDKENGVTSYPDGTKPDNKAWKDAKKYGTYIEVKAYYISTNPGDYTRGEITYRFMLGKDIELDYNAQRNYHYKLTLCFNGYANDVDWHIDYRKETREIQNPNPYYISYLYNHSMMMPLQVNTGTATITKIEAEILENGWSPLDGSPSATSIPGNNQYSLFWAGNGVTDSKAHRYNGFLSLRPTKDIVITAEKPFTMSSNQSYYDSHNRGNVTYEGADVAVSPENFSIEDALRKGKPHISHGKKEGYNVYDVHIPMWTRAKQLVKQTAYTGNNPYVAYMREAKVKITITLSDGKTLTTGIRTDGEDINEEPISIRQVRRVVNPKGVWRSGGESAPFHVVLKILPNEEATEFEPLPSDGPWRAYVMRDSKRGDSGQEGCISLSGSENTDTGQITVTDKNGVTGTYQTIEGKNGSNIDFHIKFNGTTSDDNPNYAIIRVEYNNYSCYHLIFVRQGYGPDDLIEGGTRWFTQNNVTKDRLTGNPLDEGSMFKFGNWNDAIAASNNKNGKSPWTSVAPDDFKKNAAGESLLTLAGGGSKKWTDITSKVYNDSKGFERPAGMRVAGYADYEALYSNPDIEQGFGVLYGDGATETAESLDDVYGHTGEAASAKGMRGCFVYNYKTGKNLFFPIGASGYGHRKNSIKDGSDTEYHGLLRYSCAARWGYFPDGPIGEFTYYDPDGNAIKDENGNDKKGYTYPDGVSDCPLFFDLFRRPGAIYWLEKSSKSDLEPGDIMGWDFNYFTFDFFPISRANFMGTAENSSDAVFIRCVQ